jgi:HSP20 family protein
MLARWNDWHTFPAFGFGRSLGSFSALRREMDRLFGDFERERFEREDGFPEFAFSDKGDSFELRAELPGVKESDLEVQVTGKVLSLKASRRVEEPKGYAVHRRERSAYSYAQSYELPVAVDGERVTATLKQGVLTLVLPKAAEAQPKRISVKAA